jgi:hypothetical protein
MKKIIIAFIATASILTGCSTLQSVLRSTFPYTATLIIPAGARTGVSMSATSSASSVDQIFTGQGTNTSQVREIRIASAKIDASNPPGQNLGALSSVRLYLSRSDGSGEVMVASRSDISASAGSSIVLDIDNSRFLDDLMQNSTVRVRMEYVLRNQLNVDTSVRVSLGFSTTPATTSGM